MESTLKELLDKAVGEVFTPYVAAVGTVAHSWNQLLESLGQLFALVIGGDHDAALGAWYAIKSDRSQMTMLQSAIRAADKARWSDAMREDMDWLTTRAVNLADARNVAVHAPVALTLGKDSIEIVPAYFYGNPLAERLMGRDILQELNRCSDWAKSLQDFADLIRDALRHPKTASWPRRPTKPDDAPKSAPPNPANPQPRSK